MGRSRRKRRGKPDGGFSSSGQRQIWDLLFRRNGPQGREKREYFNQVSLGMIVSAGIVGAILGNSTLGPLGAVVGFVVAGGLMVKFVVGGRYYR